MTGSINHQSKLLDQAPIVLQDAPLMQMPQDVVLEILRHVNSQEILEGNLVCRQWTLMLEEDGVWRILFSHRYPNVDPNSIENFQCAFRRICSNLTKGVYTSHTLHGHTSTVYSLAIAGEEIFSASDDGTIKVWDVKTRKCLDTLQGHTNAVRSLVIVGEELFSGSTDKTIKVWDIKTRKCIDTLQGHTEAVYSLAATDTKLFSGSTVSHYWEYPLKYSIIKVWDIKTRKWLDDLRGHCDGVFTPVAFSLTASGEELFSGFTDGSIHVFDIKTCNLSKFTHKVDNDALVFDSVKSLAIADGKLFSGSRGGTIKVLNIKTLQQLDSLRGHEDTVLSLVATDGKLFSGSGDCTIKAWDIKTHECLFTLEGHHSLIFSVVASCGKLFSGSYDQSIKIWDFTADHRKVFKEIVKLLNGSHQYQINQALDRFKRMPEATKNAIYGKLYDICKPFANDYWGCAGDAFFNHNEQSATPAQKAQAIKDYLNDQPPKNNPLLLAHLGIKTEKDYLEKLKCRSKHLPKIGISSAEDLKFICSASLHFSKLEEIVELEGDFRDNKVKAESERRKNCLETLINDISKVVEQKLEETNTCGVLLYEGQCPWINFQQKLKTFQAKFDEIAEKADTAKAMVEAFNSKNYNELRAELNALVEEFPALDLNHQIAKLHAYVNNQWGILKAWNNRRAQGIQNLSALQPSEQSLQSLLRMGE